jgi:acyl-CoA reductase-like NAD-dependent aldehyde dehydrogenase
MTVTPARKAVPIDPRELVERDWRLTIGGRLVRAANGATLDVVNPATAEVIASVPSADATDIDAAVAAGREAFESWRRVPIAARAKLVADLADAIEEVGEELAILDTVDNGTPLRVMRNDYRLAVEQLRFFAGLAPTVRGETIPTPDTDSIDFTLREPFGVVGRIVPFNHPLMFAASKLGAPLVTGNTVIVKPSQHTSLSALRLGEICREVLPPGVVNIVSGEGGSAGEALVRHQDVARIAFTGSVEVGLQVQRSAATHTVKVVTLELGGKNPIIVFPDADLDAALRGVVNGMNFAWQGQSCGSTSRLYVHRSIFDAFVEQLGAAMAEMRVGDPLDEASDVGAVVSRSQFDSVVRYIDDGLASPKARMITGGLAEEVGLKGFFIRPTLFALEDDDVSVAREEIFGPVLVAIPFDQPDQVIEWANQLRLGLTASIWTRDLETALRGVRDIETGYAWVNWSSNHIPGAPFGGVKNSGVGREEGIDELNSYTQSKNAYIRFRASA